MNANTVALDRSTYDELMYIKRNMEALEKGDKTIIVSFYENQTSGYFAHWKFFTENEVVSVCDRKINELENKIKSLEKKLIDQENLNATLAEKLIEAENQTNNSSLWRRIGFHKRNKKPVK